MRVYTRARMRATLSPGPGLKVSPYTWSIEARFAPDQDPERTKEPVRLSSFANVAIEAIYDAYLPCEGLPRLRAP